MENKDVNWEKIGLYLATIGFIFMFWQAWRDLHRDNSDLRERVAVIEVLVEVKK